MPNIPNITYIRNKTINTFSIALIDCTSATTTIFIFTLCETNLKGRRVRSILSTFKNCKSLPSNLYYKN